MHIWKSISPKVNIEMLVLFKSSAQISQLSVTHLSLAVDRFGELLGHFSLHCDRIPTFQLIQELAPFDAWEVAIAKSPAA